MSEVAGDTHPSREKSLHVKLTAAEKRHVFTRALEECVTASTYVRRLIVRDMLREAAK